MRYAVIALVLACSTKPPLTWVTDETQAFEVARRENKGVMVEFYASWAVQCDEVDMQLAMNAAAIMPRFVPLKIDVTQDSPALDKIRERYEANSLPAVVFVSSTGVEVGRLQEVPAEGELSRVIAKASARLDQTSAK